MKIIVITDSFKGTLSSLEAGTIIMNTIKQNHPEHDVLVIPVADGGEGTVEAVLQGRKGEKIVTEVSGPYFERMKAEYAYFPDDNSAVVEMACCAGLPLVLDRMNPRLTTTYGVGEMVRDAINRGIDKICVGLGGSCTTDGGCGFASALGIRFYDDQGNSFVPVGETLKNICHIVPAGIKADISAMCDVTNPLYGPFGASYVFARQKGRNDEDIRFLDEGLRHLSQVVRNDLDIDADRIPGAGAAGGLGYGMIAFTNARLDRGINRILDIVQYDDIIKDADVIITGEGRLDWQSFQGKVIDGVMKRSPDKRVIMVVGSRDEEIRKDYEVYSTLDNGRHFPNSHEEAVENLRAAASEIIF